MIKIFDLKPNDIKNFELKLDGKLPVDRDELLALVNSWERDNCFYTKDKNNKEIFMKKCNKNECYDLSKLDVSKIKNFDKIFFSSHFNGDINSWNVSNATSMVYMFSNAKYFNSPLNNWDTSKVIFINSMFVNAEQFNQPLDSWNISNVTNISFMFSNTGNFNQPLNSWNISQVKHVDYIFAYSEAFNQPVLWDLSKVESCNGMLYESKAFQKRFNDGDSLSYETDEIKNWLKDNKFLMEAIHIEKNKAKELDKFLLDFTKDKNII